ncbi:MAG: outer membrane protein transport protein, partial [Pseudomonadota bacterium]
MTKNFNTGVAPLSVLALLGMASPAVASGFALNTQSAEALGAATAGAQATPGTPGNAYFNPASIVGVEGLETSLSTILVLNDTSYENASGALFGTVPVAGDSAGEDVIGDGVFPTGAVATKLSDRIFAGLALYAPFGFNTSYDDTSVARYHGTFSQVVSGSISPILGIDLGGGWSVAAGPRFQYLDIDIEGAIDAAGIESALLMTMSVPGTDDAFVDISANDWGVGYALGVHGALGDRVTIGASFSSKVEHNLEGSAEFDISTSAAGQAVAQAAGLFQDTGVTGDLTTPATLQFGVKVDISDKMRVLASAMQTRWKSFDQLVTAFDNPAQPPEITTQNWNNTWAGAIGVEREFGPAQTVRLGVMYEEDPA